MKEIIIIKIIFIRFLLNNSTKMNESLLINQSVIYNTNILAFNSNDWHLLVWQLFIIYSYIHSLLKKE